MSASRTLMAMGQDGILPGWLGRLGRRCTPLHAILGTSAFMITVVIVLDLKLFVKAASAMMIMLFMFEMVALILMRESHIPTYRPNWRCPGYPWLQAAGLLVYGFLLVELGTAPLAIAGLILGGALVWYVFYAKINVLRESALVRVASRIAKADFREHDLEAELSAIVRHRDQTRTDRFDRLVMGSAVLDLAKGLDMEEALKLMAEGLERQVGLSADRIHELLLRRESLSTTVIRPGLAVPHVVSEDVEGFGLVLARSTSGVRFEGAQEPVHAIFAVAASPGERNFYLRALMAIAEIAQEDDFDARWRRAGRTEALREVVLAAERRREADEGDAPQ
jgi:mannitol/fructose-specific phosphotransferase system IIA component (Ntr-type)